MRGSAGWGTAESMLGGTVVIDGNAGSGVAASIRGGTVVVRGDAAARAGVSMKGGTLLIGGDCGYMAGFMMQKGRIVICGDAGDALADSMYEGIVFVGGKIEALGNDAVIEEPTRRGRGGAARAAGEPTTCRRRRRSRRSSPAASCGTSTARNWRSGRRRCKCAVQSRLRLRASVEVASRSSGIAWVPFEGLLEFLHVRLDVTAQVGLDDPLVATGEHLIQALPKDNRPGAMEGLPAREPIQHGRVKVVEQRHDAILRPIVSLAAGFCQRSCEHLSPRG